MHNSFSCNPVSKYNSALSFCSVFLLCLLCYCCRVFLIASVILSFSLISVWAWMGFISKLLAEPLSPEDSWHRDTRPSGISWISLPCHSPRLNMTLGHIIYSTAAPAWESFSYFNSRCSERETIHVFWERRNFTIYNYMTVWASYWRSLMRIWGGSKLPGNEGRCSLGYYYYL